jgi:hypothetical protein
MKSSFKFNLIVNQIEKKEEINIKTNLIEKENPSFFPISLIL